MRRLAWPAHGLATLLLCAAATAGARTQDEACPALPSPAPVVWSLLEGPDFDVCYARAPRTGHVLFGVYLGHHPSLRPADANRAERGVAGGQAVQWYRVPNGTGGYSRETVLTIGEPGYQAHVWIHAKNQAQWRERSAVVAALRFP